MPFSCHMPLRNSGRDLRLLNTFEDSLKREAFQCLRSTEPTSYSTSTTAFRRSSSIALKSSGRAGFKEMGRTSYLGQLRWGRSLIDKRASLTTSASFGTSSYLRWQLDQRTRIAFSTGSCSRLKSSSNFLRSTSTDSSESDVPSRKSMISVLSRP